MLEIGMPVPLAIITIVLGAFYVFAGFIAAREVLMDLLMDVAIAKIGLTGLEPRVKERALVLLIGASIVGASGLALGAGLDVALAFFAMSLVWQANYLFVLAPNRYDIGEDGMLEGRQQSRNAFIIYAIVTGFVAWAFFTGGLHPVHSQSPALLTILGLIWAGGTAWAFYQFATIEKRPGQGPFGQEIGTPDSDDDLYPNYEAELAIWAQTSHLTLLPIARGNPLIDAATGEGLVSYELTALNLPQESLEALTAFESFCADAFDPHDPFRVALLPTIVPETITQKANDLLELLKRDLGDRISFKAHGEQQLAKIHPSEIHMHPRIYSSGLFETWPLEDGELGLNVPDLGLSVQLSDDLWDWANEFEEEAQPSKSKSIDDRGRRIAEQLKVELDRTDRAHINVAYHSALPLTT